MQCSNNYQARIFSDDAIFIFCVNAQRRKRTRKKLFFRIAWKDIFTKREREIRGVSEWVRESAIKREFVKFIWHEESNK